MACPIRDVFNPYEALPSQLTRRERKLRDRCLPIGDHTTTISLSTSEDGQVPSTTLMVDTSTQIATPNTLEPTLAPPPPTAAASTSNPFSESSKNVTAATIGGFVGAFVLVLVTAGGMFIWFRRRAKKKRESYSRISSMPWDRSPLFMVPPSQSQLHESYRGMSAAYSFSDPLMEPTNSISVPRLLPPPRPPPPAASRDTLHSRRHSSGLILPPRPELEATSTDEKDSRHLNLQLKDSNPTPLSDTEVFRPDSVAQLNYQHYQQHARTVLLPAPKPKITRTNIDGLFPDSPTLAPSPVQAKYLPPKTVAQMYIPESPTSIYSVQDSSQLEHEDDGQSSDSKEQEQANYHIARQVLLNSPTSAHTAALPREFNNRSTRYLYPEMPKTPRTPPVPKQVHMSTAYLYAAENSRTPAQPNRRPEEKRKKLRKPAPHSPIKSPTLAPQRAQTPTILLREVRDSRQTSVLAVPVPPQRHVRKATSLMDLRQRAGAAEFEPRATTSPNPDSVPTISPEPPEAALGAWQRLNQPIQRPSTLTIEPAALRPAEGAFKPSPATTTTLSPPHPAPSRPRRVTFDPTINPSPTVRQPSRVLQEGTAHVGLRPRTIALEPTVHVEIERYSSRQGPGSGPGDNLLSDPSRHQSLGPRTNLLIPISDSIEEQEIPKIQVPVVSRSPTRFQYPGSPRLTRRSTSTLNNNGTSTLVPPRSRLFPHRSSSLNPNSHIINNPGNHRTQNNGSIDPLNTHHNSNTNVDTSSTSPESTSPVNTTATVDSKDIQDIRSMKYLSSEFGVTHNVRHEGQRDNRVMTASPTIMSRSTQNSFADAPSRPSTITALPMTSTVPMENNGLPETKKSSAAGRPSRKSSADPVVHPQRESSPEHVNSNSKLLTENSIKFNPQHLSSESPPSPPTVNTPSTTQNTFGTAVVTGTLTYSTSTRSTRSSRASKVSSNKTMNPTNNTNINNNTNAGRRGAHHSIQPPHRLMTPLSRGTNVSPRMGMGIGTGAGAGGGWI